MQSLWLEQVAQDLSPRPALDGDLEADVAIVGAGYTGLWTAYYLHEREPSLSIAIVDKEFAGFGASGRNGGWCSALFAASDQKIAAQYGPAAAKAMQREMIETVDEVGRVIQKEAIDADFFKGGTLTLATGAAHMDRLKASVAGQRALGHGSENERWLDAVDVSERLDVPGCLGAVYTPHCACLHPAKLARGLARVVGQRDVKLFEHTEALAIEEGAVITARGTIRAPVVVRATEGYTARLRGMRRVLVPLYSLMIATETLPSSFWEEVGWAGRETITDGRHLLIYGQRTADDRIAFGGRGAPYHFRSRVDPRFDHEPSVFSELHRVLVDLFPAAAEARITHRWGGPLGVPRDWFSSVGLDRSTGMAWAGGYVGDGVSTSNLAGRTLADLISERETPLTSLPWVGHRSRRWEPEPLRWIGINLGLKMMEAADRAERRTGKPSRRGRWIERLIGL